MKYKTPIIGMLLIIFILLVIDIIASYSSPIILPFIGSYFSDFHNNYLQGTIASIIGAILTVIFINGYIDKRAEKDEAKYIQRTIELLNIYFQYFEEYLLHMSNPELSDLKEFTDFHQLSNIYNTGNTNTQDYNTPVIFSFIENQKIILGIIRDMTVQLEFKHYPKVGQDCLSYIQSVETDNPFLALTSCFQNFSDTEDENGRVVSGKVRAKNFVHDLVSNHTGTLNSQEYIAQSQFKNFIYNIIRLYEIIQETKSFRESLNDFLKQTSHTNKISSMPGSTN